MTTILKTTKSLRLPAKCPTLNANDKLSTIESFNDREITWLSSTAMATADTIQPLTSSSTPDPDLLYQEVNVIYQEANEGGILDPQVQGLRRPADRQL